VKVEPGSARRRAGVLVILAAALWWHQWMPGLILVAFVAWALLHRRYQGARRESFMRFRRRIWPPAPLALAALIVIGSAVYAMSAEVIEAKVLPIALNVLAAVTLGIAAWRRVPRSRELEARGSA
jgi:hypothetical protein